MNILTIFNLILLLVDYILLLIYINKVIHKEALYKRMIKDSEEMINKYNEYLQWRKEECKFYQLNLLKGEGIEQKINEGKVRYINLDFKTGRIGDIRR